MRQRLENSCNMSNVAKQKETTIMAVNNSSKGG